MRSFSSHKVALVDNLRLKEAGVARIKDADLAHHLTHNHLKVLVVDLHTLHAIDVLNLVDDVFLNGCRALDVKNVDGVIAPSESGVPART